MATRAGILAWEVPWTEESGGLQSMGSQRVGQDWLTEHARICKTKSQHLSLAFCSLNNLISLMAFFSLSNIYQLPGKPFPLKKDPWHFAWNVLKIFHPCSDVSLSLECNSSLAGYFCLWKTTHILYISSSCVSQGTQRIISFQYSFKALYISTSHHIISKKIFGIFLFELNSS